ncbi:hypothetical protein [Runella zeae]|uniref:hypothetical protein n=1 Tax=Runella zeae TaxID=94255 RepID=UPI00048DA6DD|nr:hypothetical protein [Runella zeae]
MNRSPLHIIIFVFGVLLLSCSNEPKLDYASRIAGNYQYLKNEYSWSLSANLKTQIDITLTRINHTTLKMNIASSVDAWDDINKRIVKIYSTTTFTNVKTKSYTNFSIDETTENNISISTKPVQYAFKGEGNLTSDNKLQLSLVGTSNNETETVVIELEKK